MSRILKLLLFLTLLAISLSADKKVTLQLSWLHQFQFAGYYMAKEKGFYRDVGLDVTINEFEFGMDLLDVLESQKTDFAIGRSSLLVDKYNGKDVVALGAIYQKSPLMLLVTKKSGIESIKDLKNKKIMITSDAKNTISIVSMLNANSIGLDDITLQKHSFNLDDLINGKTDAMASYISNEPITLAEKNIDYKIFHPQDYGFQFYDDILFTSSKFIKNNPQITKDFYEATIEGWKYAFENMAETAEVIFNRYNSQNKTKIQLVKEGEVLQRLAYDNKDNLLGFLDKKVLEKIVDIYRVMGFIKNSADIDEFIYENNHHNIYELQFTKVDILLASIILILFIILIVFIFVYTTIKKRWLHTNKQLKEELKDLNDRLKKQSYIDELTKISNRKLYNEKMSGLLSEFNRYESEFSMIMFDIDDFKHINDTYGHKVGDKTLIELCKLVLPIIRKNDYFFRIGGEEFIILLTNTDINGALTTAEHIRKTVEEMLHTAENEIITISLGVTTVKHGDTEYSMFKRVDDYLYMSKNSGKNMVKSDSDNLS